MTHSLCVSKLTGLHMNHGHEPHQQAIRGETLTEILRLLKICHVSEISRRTGVSKNTVTKIARRHGIVPFCGKSGRPAGSASKPRSKQSVHPVPAEPNYRAQAAHQRWAWGWSR